MSIDELIFQFVQEGIELSNKKPEQQKYHDLDNLAGTWSEDEISEFMRNTAYFEQVDEKLWQ